MLSFRNACVALVLSLVTLPGFAESTETDQFSSLDCEHPVESGRRTVKSALGDLYLNGANAGEIKSASAALDGLVTNATYCQVKLQSQLEPPDRTLIAEWRSLHQWLNRIADTLQISVSDPQETRWRDEYTLFAEIYEFAP